MIFVNFFIKCITKKILKNYLFNKIIKKPKVIYLSKSLRQSKRQQIPNIVLYFWKKINFLFFVLVFFKIKINKTNLKNK